MSWEVRLLRPAALLALVLLTLPHLEQIKSGMMGKPALVAGSDTLRANSNIAAQIKLNFYGLIPLFFCAQLSTSLTRFPLAPSRPIIRQRSTLPSEMRCKTRLSGSSSRCRARSSCSRSCSRPEFRLR